MAKIDNFKLFVKNNPNLITYVKNNTMSWQKFYELYDLYGEDNSVWNEYLNKDTTVNTTKTESKKSSKFSDILDMAKNLDTNKLQDSISSVQKAIGLIGDILVKDKKPDASTYNPRPIYRRFDD
ncbi:MAG: spore coat protein YlbD [Bacilli bacterium]|nr:spore coat protein YlbD [Clostridium sp.]MDY2804008.1 spore coat protein YlbD [Bacilli bacterium]